MTTQNQVAPVDKTETSFIPLGERDAIKLSFSIIRRNFCNPTKNGVPPSDQDVTAFLMTCRSQGLNPFLGDAWLTGYDSQGGAKFSVLVSQRVLLKRAELHPQFDGLESGITVEDENGNIIDLATEIVPNGKELIGGWCRVFRKDRGRATYKQLPLAAYRKASQFWDNNPAGMIVKCAESDALRFAFPTANGGLRTEHDAGVIDIGDATNQVRIEAPKPVPALAVLPAAEPQQQAQGKTANEELADIVTGAGFTIDDLKKWGGETGNLENADSIGSFDDIHGNTARRLVRAKGGLLQGLTALKGGAQ